jgi:WD40 repeat protein
MDGQWALYPQSLFTVEATLVLSGRGWMSPTGQYIATGSGMVISLLDARTGNRYGPDLRLKSWVEAVAWSSTAEHIVTWTRDRILRKWSNIFESATIVAEANHDDSAYSLTFSPDDKLIVSYGILTTKIWRASDLSLVWQYSGSRPSFHPMGHRLFLFGENSVIDINIEILENVTATEHKFNYEVYGAAFDPSGNTFAATTDKGVKFFETNTFEEKTSLPYGNVEAMRFTPDGNYLLLVLDWKKVVLWDAAEGFAIDELTLDLDSDRVKSAEISKSCHMLLLECNDSKRYNVQLGSTYY